MSNNLKNVQCPGPYLFGRRPRVVSLWLSHHLLQPIHHLSLGSRAPLVREGFHGRKGRAGLRSSTWGGDGLRTKHLVTGKRMFCNFWLEFPEAEQEMSTEAGISREISTSLPWEGDLPKHPSARVPKRPQLRTCLELKAPSESWCFLPLLFSSALFFFFLNETSASFLTCWKNFPLPKLGSGTLSLWKNFSCYTVQCFFFSFFLLIELFVLSTFVLGTFLMGYFPL